jgi:hypothetical protein
MKNLKYFLLVLFGASVLSSCTDDDPADPNIPGSDRDKFTGSWLCRETLTGSAPVTFTINIQKHGTDDTLYVYNFNNLGSQNFAIWLISSNSVTIPSQSVTQIALSGSGFYSNNKINLNYISDGDSYTAECTK